VERRERIRRRDLGARSIRKGTAWIAGAALAASAGLGTLFGVQQAGSASGSTKPSKFSQSESSQSGSNAAPNGGSDDSTSTDSGEHGGLSRPDLPPDGSSGGGGSSGNGGVTSGGS
jgi:hypothetical protein